MKFINYIFYFYILKIFAFKKLWELKITDKNRVEKVRIFIKYTCAEG